MKPYIRHADQGRLAPVDWVAEPAGTWAGRPGAEIVYDPNRHEVIKLTHRDGPDDHRRKAIFGAAGYRCVASDEEGHQELWVRDRVAVARRHLERASSPPERRPGLTLGA